MSILHKQSDTSSFSPTPARAHFIETRLKETIQRFDISALLKLLKHLGYEEEKIYFQSNPSLSSPSSFCEDILFSEGRVSVVINMGLLGGNSPLPSFFRKKMDQGIIDPILFSRFLGFFDHFTIKHFLAMSTPETSMGFFAHWRKRQQEYLMLIGLNSLSSLSHLFSLCFPAFKIEVSKCPQLTQIRSATTLLGYSQLGIDSFLEKTTYITIPGFQVILKIKSIDTDPVIFLVQTIREQIEEVLFPLFAKVGTHLKILLWIEHYQAQASISTQSYLGYERMGKSSEPFQILLFSKDFSHT